MRKDLPLLKWTERPFKFGYADDFIPFLAERLSATAPRIDELIAAVPEETLLHKPAGKWSVKEHIGHLTDLEVLHEGRLNDFRNKADILRAADMANRRTEEANHNTVDAATLLIQFRMARKSFFEKLLELDDASLRHRALHPRLQQVFNVADMLYFMGEHDTHHLTLMCSLLQPAPILA